MLIVRYAAFFTADRSNLTLYTELVLSLLGIDTFVAPHVETKVVVFTLAAHAESLTSLCSKFSFAHDVVALDERYPDAYRENRAFADSLKHLTVIDRLCVVRMLSDFTLLDSTGHRLLIGTDVFFLAPPEEILSFVRGPVDEARRVLYMEDLFTFGEGGYDIRHCERPYFRSLLGDFYCLAPGVALDREAIVDCLTEIDGWPTSPSRYVPAAPEEVTTPEQHAAAILLRPFGGEALPPSRYSHIVYGSDPVVIHTHDVRNFLRRVDQPFLRRFEGITGFNVKL